MTDERNLWDEVRDKVAPFGRMKRVENSCDKGTPDVSYLFRRYPTVPPVSGWLELKIGTVTRGCPLIRSLTVDQVLWQEDWASGGGKVFTLVRIKDDHFIIGPKLLRRVYHRDIDFTTLAGLAERFWEGPFVPHQVIKCLTET